MTVGTAVVDSFTASKGTWTPYNSGTAVAGSAVPFLSDSSSTTWVQATTLAGGMAEFTSGLGNVTTGGSAIIRVRPVVRIARGDGKKTFFAFSGFSYNAIYPAASGQTVYNGGWQIAGTEPWTTAQANALKFTAWTVSSAQRFTQASFEYDLSSIPAGTPVVTSATTDKPEITWAWSDGDSGAQASAVVKVFSAAQYGAPGFDPDTSTAVWSTALAGAGTAVTPPDPIVTNAQVYKPYLRLVKNVRGVAVRSAWTAASSASTASFTAPTAPTVALSWDANNSRTRIRITGATDPVRITVTRGTATIGTALTTADPSGTTDFYDYMMARGTAVAYAATVTSAATASPILTSTTTAGTITTGTATSWELRSIEQPMTYFAQAVPVSAVSWERYEGLGVFRPLGSLGAVVVAGDMGLDDGTLEITTSTRASWELVRSLIGVQGNLLLTSPFRGVDGANERFAVRITSRSWSSDGTLTNPIQRLSADFVGVDEDISFSTIGRTSMAVSHRVVSVGTAATSLNVTETDSNPGQQLVASVASGTAYLGGSTVTSSAYGFALTPGVAFAADLSGGETLYAAAASGTVTVYVIATGA